MTPSSTTRPGFMLYYADWDFACQILPDDQLGAIIRAAIEYTQHGIVSHMKDLLADAFLSSLLPKLDADTADVCCGMRLMIEGAIVLYEDDATPLDNLARQADLHEARASFNTLGKALYELELQMIRVRVRSGMANAKAKGKPIGRPKTTKEDNPAVFYKHYPSLMSGQMNVSEFARVCGLSRPTVYKYMRMVG